jgi:hypothetical protein
MQHLRRSDSRMWRAQSGVNLTQMLRAKFAYNVRHVTRLIMQMLRAPAARGAHKGCYFLDPSIALIKVSSFLK